MALMALTMMLEISLFQILLIVACKRLVKYNLIYEVNIFIWVHKTAPPIRLMRECHWLGLWCLTPVSLLIDSFLVNLYWDIFLMLILSCLYWIRKDIRYTIYFWPTKDKPSKKKKSEIFHNLIRSTPYC